MLTCTRGKAPDIVACAPPDVAPGEALRMIELERKIVVSLTFEILS
jgi:hypothetical protein